MALSPRWLGGSLASLRDRVIQRHEFNFGLSASNFGRVTLRRIVFDQKFHITALFFLLTGCSAESKDGHILSDCMLQHLLNGSYTSMNNIECFMSLIIRSGLEFVLDDLMLHGALNLRCPVCEFSAEVKKPIWHEENVSPAGPGLIAPFFADHSQPSSQGDIEHIQRCLFRIMWLHQAQRSSCTVAGALNAQQLLYEMTRESDRKNRLNDIEPMERFEKRDNASGCANTRTMA